MVILSYRITYSYLLLLFRVSYGNGLPSEMKIKGVGDGFSKKFGSRKTLVDFHGSRNLVFSVVVCVLQSRIFDGVVSKSRFFDKAVSESRFFGFLFAAFDRLCS